MLIFVLIVIGLNTGLYSLIFIVLLHLHAFMLPKRNVIVKTTRDFQLIRLEERSSRLRLAFLTES